MAKPLPIVVSLPLDPDTLLHSLQAGGESTEGRVTFPTFCLTFLVAAGGSTTLTLTLAQGWYGVHRSPMELSADFPDPLVSAQVFADDRLVNPVPLAITRIIPVEWGEFYRKLRDVAVTVTNGTAVPVVITMWVRASFMEKSLYEQWFLPLAQLIYEQLTLLATARLKGV